VVIKHSKSCWQLVINEVPLESMQFSFINYLEGKTECTLTTSEDEPKLREEMDVLEGKATIQRDPSRLMRSGQQE